MFLYLMALILRFEDICGFKGNVMDLVVMLTALPFNLKWAIQLKVQNKSKPHGKIKRFSTRRFSIYLSTPFLVCDGKFRNL